MCDWFRDHVNDKRLPEQLQCFRYVSIPCLLVVGLKICPQTAAIHDAQMEHVHVPLESFHLCISKVCSPYIYTCIPTLLRLSYRKNSPLNGMCSNLIEMYRSGILSTMLVSYYQHPQPESPNM